MLKLARIADVVDRLLYKVSRAAALVGEVLFAIVGVLIAAEVIGRYFFNRPQAWSLELVEFTLSVAVFTGIVACTAQQGHIRIDFIVKRFPGRVQTVIGACASVLSIALFGVLAWRVFLQAILNQRIGQTSAILKFPNYPIAFILAAATVLVTLLLLSQFLHIILHREREVNK